MTEQQGSPDREPIRITISIDVTAAVTAIENLATHLVAVATARRERNSS